MNIFTKLINWLIHKLGGYTEEECTEVVDHAEEPWFELAKEYHDKCIKLERKYETEHENYLALLNCHNATADAKQPTTGVSGAIDTIKDYCNGKDFCIDCALYDEKRGCKIHEIPCYWGNE